MTALLWLVLEIDQWLMSFRTTVYLSVLANLCNEFERRFDETQCNDMRGIQALNPTNEHFAELVQIRSFAEAYDADVVDLEHELHHVERLIARLESKVGDGTSAKPDNLVTCVSCVSFLVVTAMLFTSCIVLAR